MSAQEPTPPKPDQSPVPEDSAPAFDAAAHVLALEPAERERLWTAAGERDLFLERMQRMQAEMDNMRKRAEREGADRLRQANAALVTDLLPAVDALELALKAKVDAAPGSPLAAFVDGMRLVERQLLDAFRRNGLARIDQAGVPFDPAQHAAVMSANDPSVPDQHVALVLQAGYRLYDRVLRPAQVSVNRRVGTARPATAQD